MSVSRSTVFKQETFDLNRDELRILTAIRTGQCKLKYYQSHLYSHGMDDTSCACCLLPEDLAHYFFDCSYQDIYDSRIQLYQEVYDIYRFIVNNRDSFSIPPGCSTSDLNYNSMDTFLFPPKWIGAALRKQILGRA